MKTIALFLIFVFFVNGEIVELTAENFKSTVENTPFTFVTFNAPWCEDCKTFEGELDKVKGVYDDKYVFAKVDIEANQELAQEQEVVPSRVPFIKLYRKGNTALEYNGEKTAEDVIRWIKRKTVSATEVLKTQKEIDDFLAQQGDKILARIKEGGASMRNWLRAASATELDRFQLAHVIDETESITMYKQQEEPIQFKDNIFKSKILKWVAEEGSPLCAEIDNEIWSKCQENGTPIAIFFLTTKTGEPLEIAKEVALKYKGQFKTTYSLSSEIASQFGASGNFLPTIVFIRFPNNDVTVFDEDIETFSKESAFNFIEKSLDRTYKSYVKSEPIPENNDEPVKIIVAKTWNDIVNQGSKHVFVKFYAPWCGHCKSLAPIWTELAEKVKDKENVVIAKFDATANSLPEGISVPGYPSLILFTEKHNLWEYSGDRTLEDLEKFLNEKILNDNDNTNDSEEIKEDL
jgi:protein disulfide-isomerase A1